MREYVQAGYTWVVDLDLGKFFDRVNHDMLMARVYRKVKDKRILRLIRRYLQAGAGRDSTRSGRRCLGGKTAEWARKRQRAVGIANLPPVSSRRLPELSRIRGRPATRRLLPSVLWAGATRKDIRAANG